MSDITTWREGLTEALTGAGETWADIEASTLSEAQLDAKFDGGLGIAEGCAFTVWTRNHVYFPAVYDGAEWVESVSRNPDGEPTKLVAPAVVVRDMPGERQKPKGGGGDGGGGQEELQLDPLLMALLRKIPEAGTDWPADVRARWFRTFAMNVSQVYDADTPVELDISVRKDS